jgi:hypothetical protein
MSSWQEHYHTVLIAAEHIATNSGLGVRGLVGLGVRLVMVSGCLSVSAS